MTLTCGRVLILVLLASNLQIWASPNKKICSVLSPYLFAPERFIVSNSLFPCVKLLKFSLCRVLHAKVQIKESEKVYLLNQL